MLTVAVLGPVEARRDGNRRPVPSGKTTELLVRLALDAGSRVRTDALVEDLWAEPVGRNTVQSKVSQLRRALGDRDLVVGSGDGYALMLDRGCVDALRVVDLAAAAAAARGAADPATALDKATAGLALFRGEVLVDAGDWASPHRTRLDEVRMGLVEDVLAARIELGSGGEVVAELEALVELHPLREGLWSSLITALYRAGRQADALAAYTRVRTLLIDELGIEPGTGLRALEQQVLRQSTQMEGSPLRPAVVVPGNLPPVATTMVGRAADVAALAPLLAKHRLVSVVGTAGVGKTRLALEVARALTSSGGVWLIRLDALDAADAVADPARLIAETLHVPGGRPGLVERLAGAETVLLLDNCEHLVDSLGVLAGSLLEAAATLRILTTSQVPLGIEGEYVHPLEPLSGADAVALFADRARTMRRRFVLDEDTMALVEDVCQSLDGLPLAIELAAARVRSLSLRDIARRLDDRFALLQDPSSHRPQRSRALGSAIAWSYELLFPDDQRCLWALSWYAGTATLEAAERVLVALGVPAAAVPDTITRLVDRSLVVADVADDESMRYRLLDSIRAYAGDRLQDAGQLDVAASAGAGWYADTAAWCDAHIRGERQAECLAIARAERANVDAALSWCAANDPALGARIADGFGWSWVVLGDGAAGAARIRRAVTPSAPARDRVTGMLLAGWLEASAGDLALAQDDLDRATVIAEELDDDLMRADVQRHLAFLAIQQGRPPDVLQCAATSLATYRQLALRWQTAASLLLAAYGSIMLGDTATATRDATEAVGILTPIGDSWGLVHAEAMLGGIAQAEHRFGDAARSLRRAADESQHLGFVGQRALHLATLARVLQRAGHTEDAAATFDQAIAASGACGDRRLAATARLNLARLHRADGDRTAALDLLQQNQRWYDGAGGGEGSLLNRCLLHAETSDSPELNEVLDEARATGNGEVQVYALDALARIAAEDHDRPGAERLLREADALTPSLAHLVDEPDRFDKCRTQQLLSS